MNKNKFICKTFKTVRGCNYLIKLDCFWHSEYLYIFKAKSYLDITKEFKNISIKRFHRSVLASDDVLLNHGQVYWLLDYVIIFWLPTRKMKPIVSVVFMFNFEYKGSFADI